MRERFGLLLLLFAVYYQLICIVRCQSGSGGGTNSGGLFMGSGSGSGGQLEVIAITESPRNATLPVGGLAVFTCTANNADDFRITWFKNGVFVNDSLDPRIMISQLYDSDTRMNSTLSISDLELTDDGTNYFCMASDGSIAANSSTAFLSILHPPNVTVVPQNLTVNQSDNGVLTCTGFGIPLPSLTWFNNSVPIEETADDVNISEAVEINELGFSVFVSRLTIISVQKTIDGNVYTCSGNNSVMNLINSPTTDYAVITIQVPPRIEVAGDDSILALVGGAPQLEFLILDACPSVQLLDISLLFEDEDGNLNDITGNIIGSNNLLTSAHVVYNIIGIDHDDEGNYTLVAVNAAGRAQATVSMEVQAGPIILDRPISQNILTGDSVIFNCTSSSEPLHSVSWTHNGTVIATYDAGTNTQFLLDSAKYSLLDPSFSTYGQLTVNDVMFSDRGIYSCNVSNIHESQAAYAELTVQIPPNATISVPMATGVVAGSVSFQCTVIGSPRPSIIWLVNGTLLDVSEQGSTTEATIDLITFTSQLTLVDLDLNDIGQYSCNTTNNLVELRSDTSGDLALEVLHPPNVTLLEPTEVIINQTQTASFTCQAYGIPLPNITWIKLSDGSLVENVTDIIEITESLAPPTTLVSVMTFVTGMKSDESEYQCRAFNGVSNLINSPQSGNVTLLVQVPVEIVADPIDTVHFAGGNISLSCNASGVPIPTFTWHKNNEEYLGDGSNIVITRQIIIDEVNEGLAVSTITFIDLTLVDDADYHCQASNPGAHDTVFNVSSNTAHLSVQYPPNVTTLEPLEVIINQTQEAVFTCEAYGIPVPNITWVKVADDSIVSNITGVTELAESIIRVNTTQSILTFISGLNSDESIYTCIGSNGITNVIDSPEEDNVTLLVQVPVEIVADPIDTVHFAGGNISLSCNASGVPIPTFTWHKNNEEYLGDGTNIVITRQIIIDEVNEGLAVSTITFIDLTLVDDADYHCQASNPGAHDTVFNVSSNLAHLSVQYPPNVTTLEPLEIIINQTQEAVFTCEAYGIPVPNITWVKVADDSIVSNITGVTELAESIIRVNTTQSILTFISGLNSDESIYTCIGSNGITNVIDSPEEDNVTLLVQVPVEIVADPIDTVHFAGGNISLSCNASGVPIPTFTWHKNNEEYLGDGSNIVITRQIIIDEVNEGLAVSTITFIDLTLVDDADYHCQASNPGAHDTLFNVSSNTAHLSVQYPPNVTTLEPLEVIINQTQEAVFTCEAYGIPVPNITWVKVADDSIVSNITGVTKLAESIIRVNTTQSILTFISGLNSDESIYTCIGSNGITNVIDSPEEDNVTLLVQVPVEIVADPIDTIHFAGGNISLSCNASGVPIPTFTWHKNNEEYLSDSPNIVITRQIIIDEVNEGLAVSTITFIDLTLEDDADYHCQASNPGAHDTVFNVSSNTAHLLVQHPPNVTVTPQLTVINETSVAISIDLNCWSFGIPPPSLTWTKIRTGEEFASSDFILNIQIFESQTLNSSSSTLRIHQPRDPDESNYTCSAFNSITNVIGTPENDTAQLYVQDPASITQSPTGITLPAGFPVRKMFCSAEGIPVPTITWLKNGIPIVDNADDSDVRRITITDGTPFLFPPNAPEVGFIQSSIAISDLELSDDAEYQCQAENTGAPGNVFTVLSDPVSIMIEHPPLVSVSPVTLIVNQTATATFTCAIFGIPTPSFNWVRNSAVLSPTDSINFTNVTDGNNITTVLTIMDTKRTDMGEYTCTASNGIENLLDTPESGTVTLFVQEPSVFFQTPLDVTNYTNGSAQFSCIASGIPVPEIMWLRNNTPITNGGRISINETILSSPNERNITSILTITDLQLTDTAFYHCTSVNPGAEEDSGFTDVTNTAFLKVQNPPSVRVSPLLTVINETNTTVFTCHVFGIPVPNVTWIRHQTGFESVVIDGINDPNITESVSGYTVTLKLEFIKPLKDQEAVYECLGENGVTNVIDAIESVNVTLFVQFPSQFTTHPEPQTNFTAGEITLTCTAAGIPPPTIIWLKDGVQLNETNKISIQNDDFFDEVFGETNSSLRLSDITLSDAGEYQCVANNTGALGRTFTAFSRTVTVTVQYPPSLGVSPSVITVNQTDTVPLICTVFALPRPQITWTDAARGDVMITPQNGILTIVENSLGNNTYTSVLTFLDIVKVNESNYTCTAVNNVTNVIGAIDSGTSSLTVQVPATVTSLVGPALSSRSGGTVTFKFELSEDSPPVMTQNIRWYFLGADVMLDITETTDIRFNISSDRLTLVITGVTAAQEGAYTLNARNEAGIGSGTIIFNIEGPPSIVIGPQDQIRREGDEVVFACFATGDPEPTVSWTFNNTIIQPNGTKYSIAPITDGEDFGSLTVRNINYYDKGEYTCTVTNVNGTSSDSATLLVQVVPVITVHPLTQPGIAGGNITLTCTAIGFPLPIIQPLVDEIGDIVWLKNNQVITGQLIPTGTITRVPGNTLDITVFTSLLIVDLQLRDIANYSCNASNDLFEPRFDVSQEAELTVLYPPNVAVSPKSFIVNQTQFINFTCVAFGIPVPELTWYDSSDLVNPLNETNDTFFVERTFVNGTGLTLTESVLVFSRALRTDMSSYTCIAVNNIQNILQTPETGTITLYVQVPAEITVDPVVNLEHFRGGITNLSCSAFGLPLPTVTWYKNNEILELDERVFVSEEVSITDTEGNITSTLIFSVVELSDNASYHCIANNTGAPGIEFIVQSDSGFFFITHPPNVSLTPSTQLTVNVTFEATLVCFVFAIPLPEITWIRDSDQSIVTEEPGRVSITQEDGIHNRTSTLHFSATLKSDESSYTCIAVNNITNVIDTPENASVDLVIQVPANVTPITSSPVIGVDAQTVVLEFVITQDDPLVQVNNIRWEFTSNDGTVEDITLSSLTDPHYELSADRLTLTVIQLTSAHQGTYTLFATNEAGTISNSIDLLIERPPILFFRPEPETELETFNVTFLCLAVAVPNPIVSWTFGNTNITDGGRFTIGTSGVLFGSLTISNIVFEDQGTYTCTFTNTIGAVEASTELTVQVAPVFESIVVPANGTAGNGVVLTCNSTGVPLPTITWLKNGTTTITSTPGESVISSVSLELYSGIESVVSTLELQGLVLNDRGMYSCRADNDLARPQTELSDELQLDILYPPDVSINTDSLTVNQSDTSSFTCEGFGIPLPSFTWFYNGSSDIANSEVFNTVKTNGSGLDIAVSTLTILNTTRTLHEGPYTCVASNGVDNVIGTPETAEASLIVQVPPRVTAVRNSLVGVVNRTVTLSFLIDDASPVVMVNNIKWLYNYTIILNNGTEPLLSLDHVFSPDLLNLTLTNIQHSDQGNYSLIATNEAGTDSAKLFLEVEAAPVITVSPSDIRQLEGLQVMFECEAISEPLYRVTWQFNQTQLLNDSMKYSINDTSGQLTVFSVELSDSGLYTCIVTNIHGNDSASATLTVQAVPVFIVNPINMAVLLVGESVQLNCTSFAVPVSNITWLMNGSVLDLSSDSIESSLEVVSMVEDEFNTVSMLTLSQATFNDTGLYSCMATNELASLQSNTSTSTLIIVNRAVRILTSPDDSVVNETDVVEYKCIADGLPTPSITWSTPLQSDLSVNNNDNITITDSITIRPPSANVIESTLMFNSIADIDATDYTCTASNVPNDGNTVTVNETFSITVQTRPLVMFIGNISTVVGVELRDTQMTFNVSRDLPTVKVADIRWFFTQQGNNTKTEIIAAQDDRYRFSSDRLTLTISSLRLTDSGDYTVEASNIVGTGSAIAVLDVQKAPVIIVPLISLTQLSGTTATFTCEAEADPQHTIEWTKDNQELFNSSKIIITGLGTARSTLTILDLELSDTGNYSCFAENLHGNDSTTDQLFVQVPPSYIASPSPLNLTAGASVTIVCNATGFPKPSVEILKDNQTDNTLSYDVTNGSLSNGLVFESVSLSLSELTFADSGSYSCRSSNDLASLEIRTTPLATYTVQYAPNVSVSPVSIVANESDSVVLMCEVSSLPIPSIVWLNSSSSNTITAPNDPAGDIIVTYTQLQSSSVPIVLSILNITTILKAHEANYTCVASNGIDNLLGTPENGTIPVTVQVPPSVIADVSSVLGVVNRSVVLMFSIERASPEVAIDDIQWSFTRVSSDADSNITTPIANPPIDIRLVLSMDLLTLTINGVQHDDQGRYTLTASNPAGVGTASINLEIEAAPVFVEVPVDEDRLQEETAIFRCSATSEPSYSVRWEKDREAIAEYLSTEDASDSVSNFTRLNGLIGTNVTSNNDKYQLAGVADEADFGQLTIFNSMLSDEGTYTCFVANIHGSLNASATLTVQVVPSFPGVNFTTINASAGENIVFTCNTEGSPLPNITWYKNGVQVTAGGKVNISERTEGTQRITSFLVISDVTRADDGSYWCNATNFRFVLFESMSPTSTLSVFYPPNVIRLPTTPLQRLAAQYAVFSCSITGFPVPIIQWSRTGSRPINTARTGKFAIKTDVLPLTDVDGPFTVETQLTIFNLSFADEQVYTCSGISQVNVDNFINATSNASASLFVNVPPQVVTITRSPSIAIWGTSFTISFNIRNAQPDVTSQDIQWSFYPSTNPDQQQTVPADDDRLVFSNNRRSLTITNVLLTDSGRYELSGSNVAGSSKASTDITVLVKPLIESRALVNGTLVDVGSTVVFRCRADGIPLPTLGWRRNDTVIATTGRISVSTNIINEGIRTEIPTTDSITSIVTLRDVRETDDYSQWSCIVENSVGTDTTQAILRVQPNTLDDHCASNPCQNNGTCFTMPELSVPFVCLCTDGYTDPTCGTAANPIAISSPSIIVSPQPIVMEFNSLVNLTCIASGNPQPNIEWYKDGVIIEDAKAFQYNFELDLDSRGWYRCRAVSNLEDGQQLDEYTDNVLVTINNIAQYLMSVSVSVSSLHAIYGNTSNTQQLLDTYITEDINSGAAGTVIGNNTVLYSVSRHQISYQRGDNLTFSLIVTLVTTRPSLQELYNFMREYQANPPFEINDLMRFDGCASEVTSFSSVTSWPETNLGFNATLNCPCGDLSLGVGHPTATRVCEGNFTTGAVWGISHDTSCDFDNMTEAICIANQQPSISATVQTIDSIVGDNTHELSPLNLLVFISSLESLSLEDVLNDTNLTETYLNVINTILSSSNSLPEAQAQFNLSSRILVLLDKFGSYIPVDGVQRIYSYARPNFLVATEGIASLSSFNGTSFMGSLVNPTREATASISIPEALFTDLISSGTIVPTNSRLVYTVFPNDSALFYSSSGVSEVRSTVVGATVPGIKVDNLSENNTILIQFTSNTEENVLCAYWNFISNGWDSAGCTKLTNQSMIICSCNHLTHFALISAPEPPLPPSSGEYEDVLKILEYVSIAFIAVSIVCFAVLSFTFILSWNLWMNLHYRSFISVSTSLALLYSAFIGAVYTRGNEIACTIVSGVFHYTFLTVLFALCGNIIIYISISATKSSYRRLPGYLGIISFITPLIIVGFLIAPLISNYSSHEFCHPDGLLFYIGLVLPWGLTIALQLALLLVNIVASYYRNNYKNEHKSSILRLMFVTLLFTVGWAFGFADVFVADELLQVVFKSLFIVFGCLLGLYVFIVYGLLNSLAREAWISWLRCRKEEKMFPLDLSEMSSSAVPSKNGKPKKPVLEFRDEFREVHYGPDADFRSPMRTPMSNNGKVFDMQPSSLTNDSAMRELEKEDTFMETQEATMTLDQEESPESSLHSSQSSIGYPVGKSSPSLTMDVLNEIDQHQTSGFAYNYSLSFDQTDSDEETAL